MNSVERRIHPKPTTPDDYYMHIRRRDYDRQAWSYLGIGTLGLAASFALTPLVFIPVIAFPLAAWHFIRGRSRPK